MTKARETTKGAGDAGRRDDRHRERGGIVSAAAGIAALDMPINSHDEQNFGDQSDQDVKKLSEDVPINTHDKENFGGRSDHEVKKLFEIWIAKHYESYNDLTERGKRFRIFKDNMLYINIMLEATPKRWDSTLNLLRRQMQLAPGTEHEQFIWNKGIKPNTSQASNGL
ncbi:hypothetical protein EJ110_NYTH33213 [Nymphaea thermarum]|nr:hypothetical protein EJ110_NYTH33213 [Nymphaea thermarum]